MNLGVDDDAGAINPVIVNSINAHRLTPVANLLPGDKPVVNDEAG
jgi:hypothetical protein